MAQEPEPKATGEEIHELFKEVFFLHASLSQLADKVHEQAGLTTSQIKIMQALKKKGQSTVPEIAVHLDLSRQFVQKICNELNRTGKVEFWENPRHKRSKLVSLTSHGLNVMQKAEGKEADIIEKALPEISGQKIKQAIKLLKSIRSATADSFF